MLYNSTDQKKSKIYHVTLKCELVNFTSFLFFLREGDLQCIFKIAGVRIFHHNS